MMNTEIKYRPILFSTPMVQAILEGRKTQTRRIIKPQVIDCSETHKTFEEAEWKNSPIDLVYHENTDLVFCRLCGNGINPDGSAYYKNPYGKIGDILWVREKWTQNGLDYYRYAADWPDKIIDGFPYGTFVNPSVPSKWRGKWKPSIHMPKSACRIFLKITNIKIQQLQDIDSGDAISEGIKFEWSKIFSEYRYKDYMNIMDDWRSPISSFQSLWASINGVDSWDENPWLWVIEFEKIEKPEDWK